MTLPSKESLVDVTCDLCKTAFQVPFAMPPLSKGWACPGCYVKGGRR